MGSSATEVSKPSLKTLVERQGLITVLRPSRRERRLWRTCAAALGQLESSAKDNGAGPPWCTCPLLHLRRQRRLSLDGGLAQGCIQMQNDAAHTYVV
jgi:hypothetical protein